jgi:hypothetical protein
MRHVFEVYFLGCFISGNDSGSGVRHRPFAAFRMMGHAVVAASAQQWEQKQIPPMRCGMTPKNRHNKRTGDDNNCKGQTTAKRGLATNSGGTDNGEDEGKSKGEIQGSC